MFETYEHRGKTIEVDQNSPVGIINQNMGVLENYADLPERGDEIDLGAAEILQELMKDVKQEMIDAFHFIEGKIDKIRLIKPSGNPRARAARKRKPRLLWIRWSNQPFRGSFWELA